MEGRYDKIRLSSMLDALILETNGFSIFNDKEKQKFIRRLAKERGILILTDSDAAGFKIRSFLGGILPKENVYHAYIPDIFGKEKRKEMPSAEGKLGVEAMETEILKKAILRSGILPEEKETSPIPHEPELQYADLYALGLIGQKNSQEKRKKLYRYLELPSRLSTSSFLKVINDFLGREEFEKALQKANQNEENSE